MPIPTKYKYDGKPYIEIAGERARARTEVPAELAQYAEDAEVLLAAKIVRELAIIKKGRPFMLSAAKMGKAAGSNDFGGRWVLDLLVKDGIIARGEQGPYGYEYTYLHPLPV